MLRFAALALALLPLAAGAESFSGTIRVSDADTLRVGDVTVRLFGIDAPEIGQVCRLADGRVRDCGTCAKRQVAALYDGKRARCEPRDTDRYGRTVAVCRVAGEDIGARLVRDGIAEAYRKYSLDYAALEKAAIFEERGLWAGRLQAPEDFRATAAPAQPSPVSGCVIKGNISGERRIYHVPGQAFYPETRIDAEKGERWFCTEAEAQAAGWRRARR